MSQEEYYYKKAGNFPRLNPTQFALERAFDELQDKYELEPEPLLRFVEPTGLDDCDYILYGNVRGVYLSGFDPPMIMLDVQQSFPVLLQTLGHEYRHAIMYDRLADLDKAGVPMGQNSHTKKRGSRANKIADFFEWDADRFGDRVWDSFVKKYPRVAAEACVDSFIREKEWKKRLGRRMTNNQLNQLADRMYDKFQKRGIKLPV